MFKIKKKTAAQGKLPSLYNIIEDYTEYDAPGNLTVCAMTEPEDLPMHAQILSESYDIPLERMSQLLEQGGVHTFSEEGPLLTRGAFVCRIDPLHEKPKMTWIMDMTQLGEAEQLVRAYAVSLEDAMERVFHRTLAPELQDRLDKKNLDLDYSKIDRAIAKAGDIKYIDFRKDWSPHFKRLCIMPNGKLVETSGIEEFAQLHNVTLAQAKQLIQDGGTLEVDEEVLACQIVNGQPSIARFSKKLYAKAQELVDSKELHLMDALSEVALSDPSMMRALKRAERGKRS